MSQCAQRPIQLNSNPEKDRNLAIAGPLVRDAAADGAKLIVLPEKFNVLGSPDDLHAGAEPLPGPTTEWAGALCRELGVWLVAGSIVERVEGDDKLRNTSVLVGPDGEIHAAYRKIHLFDVEVGGMVYRESDAEAPGDEVVVADVDGVELGMAVCYDLRFPELFRIMAVRGARVVSLPAAFTVPTGRAHWEILVRARAIENQVFVIAAGQIGQPSARSRKLRPLDDRRSLGNRARAGAGRGGLHRRRPRPRRPARACARSCPRSRTASRTPTVWPELQGARS